MPTSESESTDELAGGDSVATGDGHQDRFVGRAQPTVVHDHHAPSCHLAGEVHPARRDGEHRLTDDAGEVDAAVPRSPRVEWRLERSDDLRSRLQRPPPALPWPDRGRTLRGG